MTTNSMPLPREIRTTLGRLRRRDLFLRLLRGAAATALALLLTAALAMAADWELMPAHVGVRTALTLAVVLCTAIVCVCELLLPLWRRPDLATLARAVDQYVPQLEERWSTVTEMSLSHDAPELRGSPALLAQVAAQAVQLRDQVQPRRIIASRRTWVMVAALGVAGLVALVAWRTRPQVVGFLTARLLRPWVDMPFTQLTTTPGNVVVARYEPLDLSASITGRMLAQAHLHLRHPDGKIEHLTLQRDPNEDAGFHHQIASAGASFSYQVTCGDGQTPWHDVTVVDRPSLAQVKFSVTPPEYSKLSAEKRDALPRRAQALAGSEVEVAFKPNKDLATAALRLNDEKDELVQRDDDGWYRFHTTANETLALRLHMTDAHGLTNRHVPECEIIVRLDQPPVAQITTPAAEISVRPGEKVPVHFTAQDDLGVTSAELVATVTDGQNPPREFVQPIDLGKQEGARQVQATVKLDLVALNAQHGSNVNYHVRVSDTRRQQATSVATPENSAGPRETQATAPQMPAAPPDANQADAANTADTPREKTARGASVPKEPSDAPRDHAAPTRAASALDPAAPDANKNASPQSPAAQTPANASDPTQTAAESQNKSAGPAGANTKPDDNRLAVSDQPPAKTDAAKKNSPALADTRSLAAKQPLATTPPSQHKPGETANNPTKAAEPKSAPDENRLAVTNQPPTKGDQPPAQSPVPADQATKPSPAQTSSPPSSPPPASGATPAPTPSAPANPPDTSPKPDNQMAMRNMDVTPPGQSKSPPQRLVIDEHAKPYNLADPKKKKDSLPLSLSLQAMAAALKEAHAGLDQLVEPENQKSAWTPKQKQTAEAAAQALAKAQKAAAQLKSASANTPYAFVGLQLDEINSSHVAPAQEQLGVAQSLTHQHDARQESLEKSRNEVARAREKLGQLTQQYEAVARQQQIAQDMLRIQKMHEVLAEDLSMLLKNPPPSLNPRNPRHTAELNAQQAEDFSKKLTDRFAQLRQLQKELAALLAKDPELLRRFMAAMRKHSMTIRDQLTQLAQEQERVAAQTSAWNQAVTAREPMAAQAQTLRQDFMKHHQDVEPQTAQMYDDMLTWVPRKLLSEPMTQGLDVSAKAATEARRLGQTLRQNQTAPAQHTNAQLSQTLQTLSRKLDHAATTPTSDEAFETFLTKRQEQVDGLVRTTGDFARQMDHVNNRQLGPALEVGQQQVADGTTEYGDKMGWLADHLEAAGGTVAEKANALHQQLTQKVPEKQSDASRALIANNAPGAHTAQGETKESFASAEKTFDDLLTALEDEAGKKPVKQPELCPLPTIEDLQKWLEKESAACEKLGAAGRKMNLQIAADMMAQGAGSGGMGGGSGAGSGSGAGAGAGSDPGGGQSSESASAGQPSVRSKPGDGSSGERSQPSRTPSGPQLAQAKKPQMPKASQPTPGADPSGQEKEEQTSKPAEEKKPGEGKEESDPAASRENDPDAQAQEEAAQARYHRDGSPSDNASALQAARNPQPELRRQALQRLRSAIRFAREASGRLGTLVQNMAVTVPPRDGSEPDEREWNTLISELDKSATQSRGVQAPQRYKATIEKYLQTLAEKESAAE